MKIEAETIEEMVKITAGLVREGVNFSAKKTDNKWIIELTGGF